MANSHREKYSHIDDQKCEVQLTNVYDLQPKSSVGSSSFSKFVNLIFRGFGKPDSFKRDDLNNKNIPHTSRNSEAKVLYGASSSKTVNVVSADKFKSTDQHLQNNQLSTHVQKSPPTHKKQSKETKKGLKDYLPKKTKKNKKPKESKDIENQARLSESSVESSKSQDSGTEILVDVSSPQDSTSEDTVTIQNEPKKSNFNTEHKISQTKTHSGGSSDSNCENIEFIETTFSEQSLSDENQCEGVQKNVQVEQIPAAPPRRHKKSAICSLSSNVKIVDVSPTANSFQQSISATTEAEKQIKKLPEDEQNDLRKTSIFKQKKTNDVSTNQTENQQESVSQISSNTKSLETLSIPYQQTESSTHKPNIQATKEIETQMIKNTWQNLESKTSSLKQETSVETFVQKEKILETTKRNAQEPQTTDENVKKQTCHNQELNLQSGETECNKITQQNEEQKAFVQAATIKISCIMQEIQDMEKELQDFLGTSTDHPEYVYMDEVMMRSLIKLDNVETKNNKDVRQERKKGIQYIQSTLKKLEEKLKENKDKEQKQLTKSKEDVNKTNSKAEKTQSAMILT